MARTGVFFPLFDELADPRAVVELAVAAEANGWDGLFVWDHIRWTDSTAVADPWITLTAIAAATTRLRFGPLVTPLARRRPAKVARETATLDRLSGGRLTLGVGLGSDRFAGEFSTTGEELDDRVRAEMLDEAIEVVRAAWSGEPVHHEGRHSRVDGVHFLPRPVQEPGVPIWVAGYPGHRLPLRRAARHDGYFPVDLDSADQLAELVADLRARRADAGTADAPFDVVVALDPGDDPAPYVAAGATWCLTGFEPADATIDGVGAVIGAGPPAGA